MTTCTHTYNPAIADLIREPQKPKLYAITISSRNAEQCHAYDKMLLNDKIGRSMEASNVLHAFIQHHSIPWTRTHVINVEHHRHGDGKNGHFVIEALIWNDQPRH